MADNTQVQSTSTEEVSLKCEICSEYYTDPLILSNCLHSFCKKCLIKCKDEQGDGTIKCPTCNTCTSSNIQDLTVNQWLAHKVKEISLWETINSKESIPCSQCTYTPDESSNAVSFCCECSLFLWDLCQKVHKRRLDTVHHELTELGAAKKVYRDANEMPAKIGRHLAHCPQHSREEIKFYCQTCEVLVCCDCIIGTHKSHSIVKLIEKGDSARKELKQNTIVATSVIDTVSQAIVNGENMLELIDTRKKEVDKTINDTFSLLYHAALEKRCKLLLLDAEEIANNKRKVVNDQLEEFRKIKERASYASKIASSLSECTDPGEVLSIKKLVTDQVTQCDTMVKEMPLKIKENDTMFTSLDSTAILNQIIKFGCISVIDLSIYSLDKGLAIPLATVEKERTFTVNIQPQSIDNAGKYLKGTFSKSDGSEEEIQPTITTTDNDTTTVSCTPISPGQYTLSLTVRGRHIKGSPYHMYANKPKNYTTLVNQAIFNLDGYTYGVTVHPITGKVFASSGMGYVQVFNKYSANPVRSIGSPGNGDGQFSCPWGLLLVDDTLYVTDNGLHRVQYFSATTGQYLGKFGSNGKGEGQFSHPWGMAYDGKGNIIVADYINNRLQVFTTDGTFIKVIQCNGYPTDVAVDNDGYIHATIYRQNNVQVFTPDGTPYRTYTNNSNSSYLQNPQGITIDNEGRSFITAENNYLNVLDSTGAQINIIGGFNNSYGVTLDREGHVYIADCNNSRVMKYCC